jgi:hypothetical protein
MIGKDEILEKMRFKGMEWIELSYNGCMFENLGDI